LKSEKENGKQEEKDRESRKGENGKDERKEKGIEEGGEGEKEDGRKPRLWRNIREII
jgi:hypothetical protein